jgi:hypothetical protein
LIGISAGGSSRRPRSIKDCRARKRRSLKRAEVSRAANIIMMFFFTPEDGDSVCFSKMLVFTYESTQHHNPGATSSFVKQIHNLPSCKLHVPPCTN